MQPMIGISTTRDKGDDNTVADRVRLTYIKAISEAGGIPVLLPNVPDSAKALERMDGLLLTGGGDFDPASFGQPDEGTQMDGVSPARDEAELLLIEAANRLDMPIFGICRGVQAMAIAYGGSLIQDLGRARPDSAIRHSQTEDREQVTHTVQVKPDSRVGRLVGDAVVRVNSFHHQAVATTPPGWDMVAESEDGVIEALEAPGSRFLLGVQWHPEDLASGHGTAARLFKGFVEASASFQEGRRHGG